MDVYVFVLLPFFCCVGRRVCVRGKERNIGHIDYALWFPTRIGRVGRQVSAESDLVNMASGDDVVEGMYIGSCG